MYCGEKENGKKYYLISWVWIILMKKYFSDNFEFYSPKKYVVSAWDFKLLELNCQNNMIGHPFDLLFKKIGPLPKKQQLGIFDLTVFLHAGHIEVIMQGKYGRNTETTFHIKWVIGTYVNWKNQNPGGRFGATSYKTANSAHLAHFMR